MRPEEGDEGHCDRLLLVRELTRQLVEVCRLDLSMRYSTRISAPSIHFLSLGEGAFVDVRVFPLPVRRRRPHRVRRSARASACGSRSRGQKGDRRLSYSDYFAPLDSGRMDVVAFQLVTMGRHGGMPQAALLLGELQGVPPRAQRRMRGALAELWHKQVRTELGIDGRDAQDVKRLFFAGLPGVPL